MQEELVNVPVTQIQNQRIVQEEVVQVPVGKEILQTQESEFCIEGVVHAKRHTDAHSVEAPQIQIGHAPKIVNQHSVSRCQVENIVDAPVPENEKIVNQHRVSHDHTQVKQRVKAIEEIMEVPMVGQTLQGNQHHTKHQLPSIREQGHPEVHEAQPVMQYAAPQAAHTVVAPVTYAGPAQISSVGSVPVIHPENETSSATMQSALVRKDQFVFGQAPQVEPNTAPAKLPLVRMRSEPRMYDISGGSDVTTPPRGGQRSQRLSRAVRS